MEELVEQHTHLAKITTLTAIRSSSETKITSSIKVCQSEVIQSDTPSFYINNLVV